MAEYNRVDARPDIRRDRFRDGVLAMSGEQLLCCLDCLAMARLAKSPDDETPKNRRRMSYSHKQYMNSSIKQLEKENTFT